MLFSATMLFSASLKKQTIIKIKKKNSQNKCIYASIAVHKLINFFFTIIPSLDLGKWCGRGSAVSPPRQQTPLLGVVWAWFRPQCGKKNDCVL